MYGHLQADKGLYQPLGALGVDLIEVLRVQALGDPGSVDDIVERVGSQGVLQAFLRREVEFNKMYSRVGQIFLGAGGPDGGPCFHALA